MAQRVKVAEIDEIPDGDAKAVDVGSERVAIFHIGERFFAITDTCPHAGGSLSEGWADEREVTCPWHGWTFPIAEGDGSDGLNRYPVHIEGNDVYIDVPD